MFMMKSYTIQTKTIHFSIYYSMGRRFAANSELRIILWELRRFLEYIAVCCRYSKWNEFAIEISVKATNVWLIANVVIMKLIWHTFDTFFVDLCALCLKFQTLLLLSFFFVSTCDIRGSINSANLQWWLNTYILIILEKKNLYAKSYFNYNEIIFCLYSI